MRNDLNCFIWIHFRSTIWIAEYETFYFIWNISTDIQLEISNQSGLLFSPIHLYLRNPNRFYKKSDTECVCVTLPLAVPCIAQSPCWSQWAANSASFRLITVTTSHWCTCACSAVLPSSAFPLCASLPSSAAIRCAHCNCSLLSFRCAHTENSAANTQSRRAWHISTVQFSHFAAAAHCFRACNQSQKQSTLTSMLSILSIPPLWR